MTEQKTALHGTRIGPATPAAALNFGHIVPLEVEITERAVKWY